MKQGRLGLKNKFVIERPSVILKKTKAGEYKPAHGLMMVTVDMSKQQVFELRMYREVQRTLFLMTDEENGWTEEVRMWGQMPVTWKTAAGFYAWANRQMGQIWAQGDNLKRYIETRDPEARVRIHREQLKQSATDAKDNPLAEPGEIGNGRTDESRVDNVKSTQGGNDSTYLLRRLWRDRPDLAQKVADGEFPSARAAALEAGIVRRTIAIDAEDPARAAASLLRRDQRLAIGIARHILNQTKPPTD